MCVLWAARLPQVRMRLPETEAKAVNAVIRIVLTDKSYNPLNPSGFQIPIVN
jgi:hypothetical protein